MTKLTRQQKEITSIIKEHINEEENRKGCGIAIKIAHSLIALFKRDDPNFSTEDFIGWCKPENLSFLSDCGCSEDEYFNP